MCAFGIYGACDGSWTAGAGRCCRRARRSRAPCARPPCFPRASGHSGIRVALEVLSSFTVEHNIMWKYLHTQKTSLECACMFWQKEKQYASVPSPPFSTRCAPRLSESLRPFGFERLEKPATQDERDAAAIKRHDAGLTLTTHPISALLKAPLYRREAQCLQRSEYVYSYKILLSIFSDRFSFYSIEG